jgi:hypothetical protein
MSITGRGKREIVRDAIALFHVGDLPSGGGCGLSLYRGVLVVWDEDYDARVLEFIDGLSEEARRQLLVVHEREGSISYVWDRHQPSECEGQVDVDGDTWWVDGNLILRPGLESDS